MKLPVPALVIVAFTCLAAARADDGSEGILVHHEPLTSYAEATEFKSFRQDNALYSTLVTPGDVRKRIKSGGVIAVVPYPPASFDAHFEETAAGAIQVIASLQGAHPEVARQLEIAKQKWSRALAAFRALQSSKSTAPAVEKGGGTLPAGARLTRATPGEVTITHTTGVRTIPLIEITPRQVLSLNATSRTIQLPLGTEQAAAISPQLPEPTGPTRRLQLAGRSAIAFLARTLKIDDLTLSVWTFFAVLPGLSITLLVLLLLSFRRPRRGIMPARRPVA